MGKSYQLAKRKEIYLKNIKEIHSRGSKDLKNYTGLVNFFKP